MGPGASGAYVSVTGLDSRLSRSISVWSSGLFSSGLIPHPLHHQIRAHCVLSNAPAETESKSQTRGQDFAFHNDNNIVLFQILTFKIL